MKINSESWIKIRISMNGIVEIFLYKFCSSTEVINVLQRNANIHRACFTSNCCNCIAIFYCKVNCNLLLAESIAKWRKYLHTFLLFLMPLGISLYAALLAPCINTHKLHQFANMMAKKLASIYRMVSFYLNRSFL